MRGKNFERVMKFIALLNIFIFLYPVFMTFRFFAFDNRINVLDSIMPLLTMFFGLWATKYICRKEYYFTTRLLSYVAVAVPVMVCLGVYHETGIFRSIFEAFVTSIFYIIGSVNFSKGYREVYRTNTLGANVIVLTAVFIIVNIVPALIPVRDVVFIFILFNIPVTMLIMSEENIDEVFLTRGVEIPEVQRSIRKENIKLVAILYGVILVLFNIKDLLTVILKFCFLAYINISFFIMYLISKLFSVKGDSSNGNASNALPPMEPGEPNNTANIIYVIVSVAVIILILYKLIPKLIKGIAALIKYIKSKLSTKTKVNESRYNDNECEEIVEITKQSTDSWFKRKKKVNLFSMLRKSKDPAERIRLMYKIILTEIGKNGVAVVVSDTSGQILEKVQPIEELKNNLVNITPIYEKVRYGEEMPDIKSVGAVEEGFLKITGKSRL